LAVREILKLPDPVLRQRAKKVRKITEPLLRIAYDMVDTMREAGGIGLAANQVGELRRLIVVQLPEEEEASIYVNPEIIRREGTREVEEGCLSVPGYRGFINRSVWVRFGAMDHTSKKVKIKADGILSQVLEHEVDHLNGILYLDHLESHDKLQPIEPEPEADQLEGEDQVPESPEVSRLVTTDSPGKLVVPEPEETPASLKVK
jgi:peptide deformylase